MPAQPGEPDRAIAALQKLLSITIRGCIGATCATHSCAATARSDVRSAPERSALPKIGFAWTKIADQNNANDTPLVCRVKRNQLRQVFSRSHDAVIRVYDAAAGNVIETHEHAGDFKEW
jgi:hypothetical protein